MAELVDAPASGAGDRKVVEVRVLFWAPFPLLRAIDKIPKNASFQGVLFGIARGDFARSRLEKSILLIQATPTDSKQRLPENVSGLNH
jgi:hypothetical protein